ncbi:unnamed protein product [Ectocarpus sp. 12 AP-2014]
MASASPSSYFSLEDQFTFYASYHSNRVNKFIHLLCIWPIIWTGCALMTQCSFGKLPSEVLEHLPLRDEAWNLHLGTPVVMVYIFVYLVMDPFAGGVASLMMASTYLTTNLWMAGGGSARLATAAHIGCWLAQFYGHAAHEGRAPALLDNLFQAFLASPLFVVCEVLFDLGYKKDLQKRMKIKADANIAEFRASKAAAIKKD